MRPHRPLVAAAILAATTAAAGPATAASADIDAKRRQVLELNSQLAAVDAEAGAAAAAHNSALDRRDAIQARIGRTRIAARETTRRLTRSREVLSRRLVAMYVEGAPGLIDVLLQSGSLADAVAIGEVLERTADADAAVVARVRQRRRALEMLRKRLAEDAVVARRELDEARSQRRRLEALLDTRRRALDGARAELGTLLAAERERVARLAARKRAARVAARRAAATSVSPSGPPASGSISRGGTAGRLPGGSHVYPLAGPSTFGDDWLASRPGGRYHEGIDLFAARGTPVLAVADGTLFRVGHSGISGNRFWLRDAAGTEFFYAHLDGYSFAAREGATVSGGTVLGYNGDTGDAKGTSPHVHFEIHPGGGGPVRPYPIVSGWPRAG